MLGQRNPSAGNIEDIYKVPVGKDAIISSIFVCNRTASSDTFRIAISSNGLAVDNAHYIYYDVVIPANETFVSTTGITLNEKDVVRVYSLNGYLAFNLSGKEQ